MRAKNPAEGDMTPQRRCNRTGSDPLLIAYHDREWGRFSRMADTSSAWR